MLLRTPILRPSIGRPVAGHIYRASDEPGNDLLPCDDVPQTGKPESVVSFPSEAYRRSECDSQIMLSAIAPEYFVTCIEADSQYACVEADPSAWI